VQEKKYDYHIVNFTHNGKKYRTRGKSLEEAIEKKLHKIRALENGDIGISKHMTVNRWAMEWLETYKKGNVTDKVYKDYLSKFKNHILPAIGTFRLKDVTDMHLQQVLNKRAGYSFDDTSKVRNLLKAMFKQARISRIIIYDPAEALTMPKTTKGSYRSITPHERKYILALCETHRAGLWIKTMLYCGLRPGETFALDWRDIDFDKARINISRAKESGSNEIKEPKSVAGIRSIPIPSKLLDDFKVVRSSPFQPIFTQPTTKKRHTGSSGRCLWTNFKRELNIAMGATVYRNKIIISVVDDDLVPYCLRHTYGTDLQDAGVPLNVAKYLMGHSDVKVTANIYTDTSEYVIEAAANKINAHQSADKTEDNNVLKSS